MVVVAEPKAKTVRGDFLTRHIARFEEITRELVSEAWLGLSGERAMRGLARRGMAPSACRANRGAAQVLAIKCTDEAPPHLTPPSLAQEAMKPVPQAPGHPSATPAVPAH